MALAFTLAALVVCHQVARERFGFATSALATLGVFLASPIGWSLTSGGDLPLAVRLLFGSTAAYAWIRLARDASGASRWGWAAAGLAGGLVATLQWPGSPARLLDGAAVEVLWSSRGGLFATAPALYLGALGLFALWRVDRTIAVTGLALLTLTTLLVASVDFWWMTGRPSPQAFAAVTPYLVCGAAAGVDLVAGWAARRPILATAVLVSPLVLWNLTLVQLAHEGVFRLGEPTSFGDIGAAQAERLHAWIGHPFSAPASLGYAVANGVRPGAYDLLAPNRLLARGATTGTLDVGTGDAPYVGDGWHAAERDGAVTFRWAMRSASLDLPLDHAADLLVQVDVRPYQPPNQPPQQLTLVVNGEAQAPVTLASGWQPVRIAVPQAAWRSGVNHLELRFAYEARPSDAGIPDGRVFAASVDAVVLRAAS
jgi:hypothetical protein